jgi:hypothetical protein
VQCETATTRCPATLSKWKWRRVGAYEVNSVTFNSARVSTTTTTTTTAPDMPSRHSRSPSPRRERRRDSYDRDPDPSRRKSKDDRERDDYREGKRSSRRRESRDEDESPRRKRHGDHEDDDGRGGRRERRNRGGERDRNRDRDREEDRRRDRKDKDKDKDRRDARERVDRTPSDDEELLDLKMLGIDEITEEDYLCVILRSHPALPSCTICSLHTLQLAHSANCAVCSWNRQSVQNSWIQQSAHNASTYATRVQELHG